MDQDDGGLLAFGVIIGMFVGFFISGFVAVIYDVHSLEGLQQTAVDSGNGQWVIENNEKTFKWANGLDFYEKEAESMNNEN